MEGKKPYQRRGSISRSRSELFICFTSRASSSSTSNSSKWILQRSRTEKFREGSTSTVLPSSSSLRRRLRSNGSLKKAGQSSPMILTETTEPSSPKVTCIGQVRVKMKKQGKKMRSKKTQEGQMEKQRKERFLNRNQRWVHLPLSICEGLRSFGAEFCCFQPCGGRSRDKGEKSMSSSGAVFERWLVVGEKEEEMERERKDEEREYMEEIEEEEAKICIPPKNALLLMRCRSDPVRMSEYKTRFWESPAPKEEDNEFNEEENDDDDNEDEVRGASVVEINAREEREEVKKKEMIEKTEDPEMEGEYAEENLEISDRIKVAEEEENESPKKQEQQLEESHQNSGKEEQKEEESDVKAPSPQFPEILEEEKETSEEEPHAELEEIQLQTLDKQEEEKEKGEVGIEEKAQEVRTRNSTSSVQEEEEEQLKEEAEKTKGVSKEQEEEEQKEEEALKEEEEQKEKEALKEEEEEQKEKEALKKEEEEQKEKEALKEDEEEEEAEKTKAALKEEEEKEKKAEKKAAALKEEEEEESKEHRTSVAERERGKQSPEGKELPLPEEKQLPDCLLMMMYEPKVSMEVSKETWVCSTDFLICRPTKPVDHQKQKKEDHHHHHQHQQQHQKQKQKQQKKRNEYEREKEERRRLSTGSYPPPPPPQQLPPRASISTVIEQKLVNAVAYEPFVLKRCKSEPVRSTAKLPPDSCFWKTSKLPHVAGS